MPEARKGPVQSILTHGNQKASLGVLSQARQPPRQAHLLQAEQPAPPGGGGWPQQRQGWVAREVRSNLQPGAERYLHLYFAVN